MCVCVCVCVHVILFVWGVCARARVVTVKVHADFFAATLSKRAMIAAGEGGEHGNLQTYVVETNVVHSAGSKASLADVGLMVPSHARGFQ